MAVQLQHGPASRKTRLRASGTAAGTREPDMTLGSDKREADIMGRSILLWLIGVPIPIIILIALFWH